MTPTSPPPPLRIDDLLGNRVILEAGQEAIVGRSGTFPVGTDDVFLHRSLFQVWYGGLGWMIANRGRHIPLDIEPRGSRSLTRIHLGPGAVTVMPAGPSAITFTTPERHYEIHIDIPSTGISRPSQLNTFDGDITHARHIPNDDQRIMLDALAAPLIKNPGANDGDLPTVKELAEQLGWTEKKTNQKIERLCQRLAQDGENVYKPYKNFLAHYAASQARR
ncbi:DNA-binding response regulator [Corynebacterium stationis]|uniref:DNA-binding response regulator n=1 Tax=Corynebacterium stationis TaxID=1705 RepID=UPI00243035FC|nr:DNA-binding response regulator [Corynebacterium stationis]